MTGRRRILATLGAVPVGLLAAALTGLLAGLLLASPARAGGWAATLLDPLPSRVEVGRTYTVGYWVLQHGTHPYDGDLGATALVLVDPQGQRRSFPGVPLAQPAHYATALVVPSAGSWRLEAEQGLFGTYVVGTLTAPGRLVTAPLPPGVGPDGHDNGWGAIRPPTLAAVPSPTAATARPSPMATPAAAVPPSRPAGRTPAPVLLAPVLAVLAPAGVLVALRWRRHRLAGPAARSTGSGAPLG